MKMTGKYILYLVLVMVGLIPIPGFAEAILFTEGSRIQINGDSTFRKFSSMSTTFNIKGISKPAAEPKTGLPWTPSEVEMNLEVKSLKSGSGTLDKHMYENLKSEKYPQIFLKLSQFKFEKSTVVATGILSLAGVTKPVELKGDLEIKGNKLSISGSQLILMSDYGITPPTMMKGIVKTADKIEVVFKINSLINNKEERNEKN